MKNQTKNKQQVRENRILDATAILIVQYGYDKTSVSDIAKKAGISKGAVYLHFKSKDALIYRLILREVEKFLDEWAIRIKNDTSEKVFASMYRHVLALMKEDDFLWALFSKQRWLMGSGFIDRPNSNIYQQRLGLSDEMLTKLKAVGAIRQDITPATTAYVFNMLNYGYLKLGDVIPEELAPPTDEVVHEIGELVQRHLQVEGDSNVIAARQIIIAYIEGARQLVQQLFDDTSSS